MNAPPGIRLPRAALLDLDGTLIDTVPDIAWCMNRTLEWLGLPRRSEDEVRRFVGNGVERLVKRCLTGDLEAEPEHPDVLRHAVPRFRALYSRHVNERSSVYAGVEAGLDGLASAGVRLGCVTNKPSEHSEKLLREAGLRARFAALVCGDTLPHTKPDPAPLLHAARELGTASADTLVVGDSVNDVVAARRAGMAVVCVTYGYNHGEDIRDAGPDAAVDSLAALPALLVA